MFDPSFQNCSVILPKFADPNAFKITQVITRYYKYFPEYFPEYFPWVCHGVPSGGPQPSRQAEHRRKPWPPAWTWTLCTRRLTLHSLLLGFQRPPPFILFCYASSSTDPCMTCLGSEWCNMMQHMSGGQNYLLLAMDMAKVGGPLSVVKVCTSMLCVKIGYR
jgi:hypothetical protein